MDQDMHTPPDPSHPARRFTARAAIVSVLLTALLLVIFDGDGIRRTGEKMDEGTTRDVVLAVGHPAGWLAEKLPFASAADQITTWFATDEDFGSRDGTFGGLEAQDGADVGAGRVPPQAFAPGEVDGRDTKRALRTLLVTGDSMAQPMDAAIARSLTDDGVRVLREARIGTAISKTDLLDWGQFSQEQARERRPDAVVVFLGANEGFPMETGTGTVDCCDAQWAAEYATRVRAMMSTYSRGGATQVYWFLLPASRDPERSSISRTVNAAIKVAAGPFGAQVRLIDMASIFTPDGGYQDAIPIAGRDEIVRDADGIHLNERGGRIAADTTIRALEESFTFGGAGVE